ncbi:MAG: hypothetical protein ACR2KQ_12230 [Actinomycetota bacterium]
MPTSVLERPEAERDRLSEDIADRLDGAMTAAGILFLLVVLGETLAEDGTVLERSLFVLGWVLWAVFVAEFVLRMVIAPSTIGFLRKNWWQILFLVLPFLRFLRLLRIFRLARGGRVISSAIRATRTAGRQLADRAVWLAAVTSIVILASSQLLYEFGGYESYGEALHGAALATIVGEPLKQSSGLAQVMEVVLALYSVVFFASLAATVGAYFLESRSDESAP